MDRKRQILNIEDSEDDSVLLRRFLEKAGVNIEWKRIDTLLQLQESIQSQSWDLIVTDFSIPGFTGLDVIKARNESGIDTPIIIISGTIDQESAVQAMRLGASDYLMKDDLARFAPAVRREFEQADNRKLKRQTESALAESENRLQVALRAAGLGAWEFDLERDEFFWSPEALAILGLPDHERTDADLRALVHSDDAERFDRKYQSLVQDGNDLAVRVRLRRNKADLMWAAVYGRGISDPSGKVVKLVGTIKDVTLDKNAEDALIEAEKRYRVMAESASDAVISIDEGSRITYANPSCEQIFGYSPLELIGKPLAILMSGSAASRHMSGVKSYLKTGERRLNWKLTEAKGLRKDGTEIDIQISFGHHNRGEKHSFTGYIRDVSDSKRAEETLRRSEANFRALVKATTQFVWQLDDEGHIIEYPYWWEELTGQTASESVNFGWLNAIHADDRDHVRSKFVSAIARGEPASLELRIRSRDGQYLFYEASAVPLPAGDKTRWICALKDLTELRTAEERFRLVSSISTDFMFESTKRSDGSFEMTWVGGAFERITGYSPNGLKEIGGWQAIVHPEDREKDRSDLALVSQNKNLDSEIRIVRNDGETVWVRVVARPIWDEETDSLSGICGAVQDITERKVAEIAVRETAERLRTILDTEPECVKILNKDAEIIEMNPAGLRILEASSLEQLIGQGPEGVLNDDHVEGFRNAVARAMSGESVQYTYELKTGLGNWKWLEMHAVPLRNALGEITSVIGVSRDITEKKKSDELLRSSQQNYSDLINSVEGIVWEADIATFSFTFVSKQAESILGYEIDEWLQPDFWQDHIHRDDRGWAIDFCVRSTERGEPHTFEYRMIAKDGRTVWLRDIVSIVAEDGRPTRLRGIMVDVTEKRLIDAARQRQAVLIEQANEAIFTWDLDFGILEWNKGCERLYGYTKEEALGKFGFDLIHSRSGMSQKDFLRMLKEKREWSGSVSQTTKDGRTVFADSRYQVIDIDGRDVVLQTNRDVTESRLAQEALSESEARYRHLFENSPYPMWVYDVASLKFLAANDCAVLKYGYSLEEFLAMKVVDIRPEEDRDRFLSIIHAEMPAIKTHGDWRHKTKSGKVMTMEISSHSLEWNGISARLVIAHDVSDRLRAELALKASESKYRELFENANDIIYTHDLEGRITSLNRAGEKAFGYSEEEAKSMNIAVVIEPKFLLRARRLLEKGVVGMATRMYETEAIAQDGRTVPLEISARLIFEDGKAVGVQGIARDISERLANLAALRSSEDQLRQSQKLESIGILAGGLAHDFNNMLTAINGYSDLVLRKLSTNDPIRKNVEEIRNAGARSAELTSQLLAFGRRQILQPKVFDLNQSIDDTTTLLERLIGEDIDIVKRLDSNLAPIEADPGQLSQVLMNLAVNSRDAMPNGGTLAIETSNVYCDEEAASKLTGGRIGSHVLLSVSDTGTGMDEETSARVFEPFFTTKAVGKGTGLGLSTVYGIVKQSGGNVWVTSEPGIGTKFEIYFPAAAQVAYRAAESSMQNHLFTGSGKVLLVEDEAAVRGLASKILESCGYTVIEAMDGQDALEKFESQGPIDVLITDVVMPRMNGRELSEILEARSPGLKILFTSGYMDDSILRLGIRNDGKSFLQKPFTFESLAGTVRSLIDS